MYVHVHCACVLVCTFSFNGIFKIWKRSNSLHFTAAHNKIPNETRKKDFQIGARAHEENNDNIKRFVPLFKQQHLRLKRNYQPYGMKWEWIYEMHNENGRNEETRARTKRKRNAQITTSERKPIYIATFANRFHVLDFGSKSLFSIISYGSQRVHVNLTMYLKCFHVSRYISYTRNNR